MSDDELLRQFESCELPFERWTHRTHVRIAFLYLDRLRFHEAVDAMRRGVKAYNAANDVPESRTTGYNETTTVAFMHLIHVVMVAYSDALPVEGSDAFCDAHPQLMSKHVLRFFYSPVQRMRDEAKAQFVEPDLAPLPVVPEAG